MDRNQGPGRWRDLTSTWNEARSRIQLGGRRWLTQVAELLFPPVCLVCGAMPSELATPICSTCEAALCEESVRRCPRCAKPLPQYALANLEGCALCRSKRWKFAQVVAFGTYGGLTREVVIRMKQVRHEALCYATGELLAAKIQNELAGKLPQVVAPVPMHWLRRVVRGTNDSELLAETVAKDLAISFDMKLLRCLRPTRKQGTLMPSERRLNVRGAYGVRRRVSLDGAHVLLVDDVMTTGATANEISRVLLRAGAGRVSVAVVARGVGFD